MWPKNLTTWIENQILYISIPFTWLLPEVRAIAGQMSFLYKKIIVGGPAIELMPNFLKDYENISIGQEMPGILQKINPLATRTTLGCPKRCKFCGVGQRLIDKEYIELDNWPHLPVIMDNNLLAASPGHFDRVIDRLQKYSWCDFNQGLDARLLTEHHAVRLATLKKPHIRLALDHMDYRAKWERAFQLLRAARVAKKNISSYCLVGFNSSPLECWERCEYVESHGVKAYPMWYHSLDQLQKNIVTENQRKLGWNEEVRKNIMGYYYKHRGRPLYV